MSTFTIPFPEYDIAEILQREFPKKDNFSVAIPLSRQQKFYDLLLVKGASKRSVTIQVKSSRTYLANKKAEHQFFSWLNHFDIKDNYSDFYFIYMTYPLFDENFKPQAKWSRKILVFNQKEMVKILDNVKTKAGKPERFFSFGFDANNDRITGQRGFSHLPKKDYSANLLENKIAEIKKKF
jgi:hypothetical protein